MQAIKTIGYGDPKAQLLLWQKAFLLVPLWAIPLIPVAGFLFRAIGHKPAQFGYGMILAIVIGYFLNDLLRRKIRLDDDYVYHGFTSIPLREVEGIDVIYKKPRFLPTEMRISSSGGKTLKLSLNGLREEGIGVLLKHLQAHNPNLEVAPVLSTLVKCHTTKPRKLDNPEIRLEVPYKSRLFIDESIDTFKVAAGKWIRVGPLALFFVAAGPVWMQYVSALYCSLQSHAAELVQSLATKNIFLQMQPLLGIGISATGASLYSVAHAASQQYLVIIAAILPLFVLFMYSLRLLWQPNILAADKDGMSLLLRFGNVSIPVTKVDWSDVASVDLNSRAGKSQLSLTKNNGKKIDIDLAGIGAEYRRPLLSRLEKRVSNCQINHELSQTMSPQSAGSYTEIWLQALSEPVERKTLEPLQPGQLIGNERFEVLRDLGVGGQGAAYLCRPANGQDQGTVVLKETIIPIFAEDWVRRRALEKFEQEARLLKSLNYQGIVQLLDFFIEDHRAYLVLEHIDGLNLRQLVLSDGPLPEEEVRELTLQMCAILKFLHNNGIIHRDFTPDNLMLNSSKQLKLLDFNVAQQIQGGSTGTIVGKHAYLPPEQFRGKATTKSDLYALGATVYFLLTGQDPEPISQSSPKSKNATVSDTLDQIVRKATALKESSRFQSAAEIEQNLLAADALPDQQEASLTHG